MTDSANSLLFQAQQLCLTRGIRFTPIRQQIFLLMAQHNAMISAYDLLAKLQVLEPNAKPPTVYRALDFLLEEGFIHKIESSNAFILCPHFDEKHPSQLLLCKSCGAVIELHNTEIETLLQTLADQHGFAISTKTVEAHGICADCRE